MLQVVYFSILSTLVRESMAWGHWGQYNSDSNANAEAGFGTSLAVSYEPTSAGVSMASMSDAPTASSTTGQNLVYGDETATTTAVSSTDTSTNYTLAEFQERIVAAHNAKRALHGSQDVAWNTDMGDIAQAYADNFTCSNDVEHSSSGYAENIGYGYPTPESVVEGWYSEIEYYNWSDPSATDFDAVGHFENVLWNTTTKIGCGVNKCNGTPFIVCDYCCGSGSYEDNIFPLISSTSTSTNTSSTSSSNSNESATSVTSDLNISSETSASAVSSIETDLNSAVNSVVQAAVATEDSTSLVGATLKTSSTTASASTSTGTDYTLAEFKERIVAAHNAKRALHGDQDVSWDTEMAEDGQTFADDFDCNSQGNIEHSSYSYAENIAYGFTTPEAVVEAWYSEISYYNWDDPAASDYEKVGHFENVVWNTTTKIGCGLNMCSNGLGPYVVCEYCCGTGSYADNIFKPTTSSAAATST